jgi:tetratricopeptide (TPR) repeat protein
VPNASRAQLALARLYEATDRSEEALEQYRATADTDPSDPEPLLSAARLALTLERDVLAAGYLDRLLERHPRLARGLALYGDVMRARGMRDEARQYYRKALDEGRGELDREQVTQALAALDEPESSGEELQPAVVAPN